MIRSRVTLATIDAAAIAALLVSPSTTARWAGASGPSRKPSTRHASARGARSASTARSPQRFERCRPCRSMSQAGMIAHRDLRRHVEHGPEEHLAHLGLDLLRVVQQGERPRSMAVQRCVVEQDAGDDERARQRSPARLVGTGDEAHAEPAVVAEEPLSGRGAHRLEDIARPGTCSCRARAGFVTATAGGCSPRSSRSRTTSQPAFPSVAPKRSQPPVVRRAAQMNTVASCSMNQGRGLCVQRTWPV